MKEKGVLGLMLKGERASPGLQQTGGFPSYRACFCKKKKKKKKKGKATMFR